MRRPDLRSIAGLVVMIAAASAGSVCVVSLRSVTALAASVYYVTPNGSPSGDGSAARPLDLATALSTASPARGGDTIWVRAGTYRGPYNAQLSGTSTASITIRAYPGERATIDAYPVGGEPLAVTGSNLVIWGLEIMSSDPNRIEGQNSRGASGIDILGANVKIVNMVVHDNINGIGAWMVPDTEIYGNVIYNNGVEGTDRGHGHSIYAQNNSPNPKRIVDNVMMNSYSIGMQAYTVNGRIDNIYTEGNIAFNHGLLSLVSGVKANFLWQGPSPTNPSMISNYSYYSPGLNGRTADLTGPCVNPVIENNYLVQGWIRLDCGPGTIDGNTVYGDPGGMAAYPNNTFLASRPTGVKIFIRPNRYEPGRANIAIFNWDLQPRVSVSLSSIGLGVGTPFEIRDAENFYGTPLVAATYDGNPVSIPMTGLTVAPAIGGAYTPPHTAPEFGAFVVLPRTGAGGPPTTLSVAPATIAQGSAATLTWSTSGATGVSIDPGIGSVSASGSLSVSPTSSTTYVLTASNSSGISTQMASVTVVPAASPDGASTPPLTQLVDSSGNVWTLGSDGATLRNGVQVGGGYASQLLWYAGSIYALGRDNSWWVFNPSIGRWASYGTTRPGGTTTPPAGSSPDGSIIPPATQLVDASLNVWMLTSDGRVLRNGSQAAGGVGSKILWSGGAIYVLGFDNNWWKWNGGSWQNVGPTQPGGTSPSSSPTASPDGSMIPPLAQLVDGGGSVWTLASDGRVLRNGNQAAGGVGSKILWSGGIIYVLGADNNWWKWNGGSWQNIGPTQPGATAPSSSPPPSPDGSMVPPLTQLVDASGNTWTLASDGRTLRNGIQVGGGVASKLLWRGGVIYALGRDNNWWQWNPSAGQWILYGPTQPA